jgi:hypothetical protein
MLSISTTISKLAKQGVLATLRRFLASAAVQDLLGEALHQPRRGHRHLSRNDVQAFIPPYPDLGHAQIDAQTIRRQHIVFITARFRSGSTLLWNLFRHL